MENSVNVRIERNEPFDRLLVQEYARAHACVCSVRYAAYTSHLLQCALLRMVSAHVTKHLTATGRSRLINSHVTITVHTYIVHWAGRKKWWNPIFFYSPDLCHRVF